MMNNPTHAFHTGLGDTIISALLCSFAPATLLLMVVYAGFCA